MEGRETVSRRYYLPPNTKGQLDGLDEQVRLMEESLQGMKQRDGIQGIPLTAEVIRKGLSEQLIKTSEGYERPPFAKMRDASVPTATGAIPVRIYSPASSTTEDTNNVPVLIYIHGGGFVAGELDAFDFLCQLTCCITGCGVVSVHYRRAPEDPFPAGLHDCLSVAEWVAAGKVEGFDVNRIVLGGESCGASLAIGVCILGKHLGIKGQFLGCPMINPLCDTPSFEECGNYYTSCTSDIMHWCWGQYLPPTQGDNRTPYVVPYLEDKEVLKDLPPSLVTTAQFDPLRDEGELLAKKLQECGVTVQMTRYAGHEHCFWVHPKLSRSIVAWQEMATFIRRCVSLPDVDVSSLIPKSWATTAASNWKQMQEGLAGKV